MVPSLSQALVLHACSLLAHELVVSLSLSCLGQFLIVVSLCYGLVDFILFYLLLVHLALVLDEGTPLVNVPFLVVGIVPFVLQGKSLDALLLLGEGLLGTPCVQFERVNDVAHIYFYLNRFNK